MERPRESVVPEPQRFDPARSDVPPLPVTADGDPGVVLLVAPSPVRQDDWAERAAAALAGVWADQGRSILLADFALARPGLHRVLEVANGEGVTDALLFGSSVQRVARPVEGGRFLFMPAGTATARPQAVTASPRFAAIVEACKSVRATPVVFLPSDLPGGEALLGWATDVLLLTDPAQVRHEALARGIGERLRGILIPPGEPAPAEVAEPAVPALLVEPAPLAEPEAVEDPEPLGEPEPAAGEPLLLLSSEPEEEEADEPVEALPMFDLDAYVSDADVSAEVEPDEEQPVEPLPTLDIEVPADKEEIEQDAATIPLLGGEAEPEGGEEEGRPETISADEVEPADPWAEAETVHQRAEPASTPEQEIELGEAFAIKVESAPAEGEREPEVAALDPFLELPSAPDSLLDEPVTLEQEEEQAAAFDLSGFDGMLEKPNVQSSQPVVLEPEEEPVVAPGALGGDTLPPPPPEPGGFGLSDAVPPEAAAPAPPPPRTPAASDLSRPAPRSAAARPATRPTPRPAQPTKSRVGLLLALLVASILLLVGVAWFGYIEVPWLSPWLAGLRGQPVSVAPVPHGPSRVDILAFVLELPAPDAPIERTGHHLA